MEPVKKIKPAKLMSEQDNEDKPPKVKESTGLGFVQTEKEKKKPGRKPKREND
jgi:hypothetical protein